MSESETVHRRCPICNEVKESQGLYAHVMNSSDEEHGPQGSVPDEFNPREAPVIGDEENGETIEADLPDPEGENILYMCHHCGNMAKGRRGLSIHLSKAAGDELHPEGASIEDENFTEIPANDDWEPTVDQTEVAELHAEITSDINEYELLEGEGRTISEERIEEMRETITIPTDVNKVRQVAAVISQEPDLYNRADIVEELVNCSTTTFYEGRKMYDNNPVNPPHDVSNDVQQQEATDRVDQIAWEGGDESVIIGGEHYIPLSRYKEMVKEVNRLNQELNEVGNKGAQVIYQNQ